MVRNCTAWHCTAQLGTALHCLALHCTARRGRGAPRHGTAPSAPRWPKDAPSSSPQAVAKPRDACHHCRPAPQLFESWLSIKSGRSRQWSSSSRWARAHGLQEQRLYEMAKLKRQFAELLEDAGGCVGVGGGCLCGRVLSAFTCRWLPAAAAAAATIGMACPLCCMQIELQEHHVPVVYPARCVVPPPSCACGVPSKLCSAATIMQRALRAACRPDQDVRQQQRCRRRWPGRRTAVAPQAGRRRTRYACQAA